MILPHLCRGAAGARALEGERSKGHRDLLKYTVPPPPHGPWHSPWRRDSCSTTTGNVFVRIREIKKEEIKVESMQARAVFAYCFPLQNIKGSLNVIMLGMLPFPSHLI